jgi:hypothetical protein
MSQELQKNNGAGLESNPQDEEEDNMEVLKALNDVKVAEVLDPVLEVLEALPPSRRPDKKRKLPPMERPLSTLKRQCLYRIVLLKTGGDEDFETCPLDCNRMGHFHITAKVAEANIKAFQENGAYQGETNSKESAKPIEFAEATVPVASMVQLWQ